MDFCATCASDRAIRDIIFALRHRVFSRSTTFTMLVWSRPLAWATTGKGTIATSGPRQWWGTSQARRVLRRRPGPSVGYPCRISCHAQIRPKSQAFSHKSSSIPCSHKKTERRRRTSSKSDRLRKRTNTFEWTNLLLNWCSRLGFFDFDESRLYPFITRCEALVVLIA